MQKLSKILLPESPPEFLSGFEGGLVKRLGHFLLIGGRFFVGGLVARSPHSPVCRTLSGHPLRPPLFAYRGNETEELLI